MDAFRTRKGTFNAVMGNHDAVLFVSNPQALQRIFCNDTRQFIMPLNQLLQTNCWRLLYFSAGRFAIVGELMPPFHGESDANLWTPELVDKRMSSLSIGTCFLPVSWHKKYQ